MADNVASTSGLLLTPSRQQELQKGIPEHLLYKNRLQEFTQSAAIPFPVYCTFHEGGAPHNPQYRTTVKVDGEAYTCLNSFSTRKAAEQDAARLALEGITKKNKECASKKTTDEGFPPIYQDKVFCKTILHDFAAKMNIKRPIYDTVGRFEGLVHVFVSSLVFNGVTYSGPPSVNKKGAEQLVARVAILSILANSEVGMYLSEIVKSKGRFFSAVHDSVHAADPISTQGTSGERERSHVPPVQAQTLVDTSTCGSKRKCKRRKKANKKAKTKAGI